MVVSWMLDNCLDFPLKWLIIAQNSSWNMLMLEPTCAPTLIPNLKTLDTLIPNLKTLEIFDDKAHLSANSDKANLSTNTDN